MSEKRELICIRCPLGCALSAEMAPEGSVLSVTGNTCKRGEEYAKKELTAPTRMVTSTITVTGGMEKRVSVKTASDIPKDKIFSCMEEIHHLSITAPVHIGQVVLKDVAGTKVDVVATTNVEAS